jgi:hypothetical protein
MPLLSAVRFVPGDRSLTPKTGTLTLGGPRPKAETATPLRIAQFNGDFKRIDYWTLLPNWENWTLIPNPDDIYFMPFISTEDVDPVCLRFHSRATARS